MIDGAWTRNFLTKVDGKVLCDKGRARKEIRVLVEKRKPCSGGSCDDPSGFWTQILVRKDNGKVLA